MSKAERKLQDRLNRVGNLFPGKRRIWELDRIAQDLYIQADVTEEDYAAAPVPPLSEDECQTLALGLRADALLIHRLAWDLMEIRDVLRGGQRGTDVTLSKYDQDNWRGPRP